MKKLLIIFLSFILIGCNDLPLTKKIEKDGWQQNLDNNQVWSNVIDDIEYHLDLENNLFYYYENKNVKYEVDFNKEIVTRLLDGSNYVSYDEKNKTTTYISFEDINEDLIKDENGKIWLCCKYDYLNHEFLDYAPNQKYTCTETGINGSEFAYDLFKNIILDKYDCSINDLLSE